MSDDLESLYLMVSGSINVSAWRRCIASDGDFYHGFLIGVVCTEIWVSDNQLELTRGHFSLVRCEIFDYSTRDQMITDFLQKAKALCI